MAYSKIRPRRDTLAGWQNINPVLNEGEFVIEAPETGVGTGLIKVKIGDGFKRYMDLPYAFDGTAANAIYGGDPYEWHDIYIRTGTTAEWEDANPILGLGEITWDSDELRFKIGDGVHNWTDLKYIGGIDMDDPLEYEEDSKYDNMTEGEVMDVLKPGSTLQMILNAIKALFKKKATKNHASSTKDYGVGTTDLFGHLKISDKTDGTNGVEQGVAASEKAVGDLNTKINNTKTDLADKIDNVSTNLKNYTHDKYALKSLYGNTTVNVGRLSQSDAGSHSFAFGTGIIASGNYSHAEGANTTASGNESHSEGYATSASGADSHAEGYQTIASGAYSHAEGCSTKALKIDSHAEGFGTTSNGNYSHAEGCNTSTSAQSSHAEGEQTLALGNYSHSEGYQTTASGLGSHAEGHSTGASSTASHAEGYQTTASGAYSHAEGYQTIASGLGSHADSSGKASGENSHADSSGTASGKKSHADSSGVASGEMSNACCGGFAQGFGAHATGVMSTAIAQGSHAEGYYCVTNTNADYSHAEGIRSTTSSSASHAEGTFTIASGSYSHAEGNKTTANGMGSHAEGYQTTAGGTYSHAEGYQTTANGNYSHAEGYISIASGLYSHAAGQGTTAIGNYSHAEGYQTCACTIASHVEGSLTKATGLSSHAEGNQTKSEGDYSHAEGHFTGASSTASHAEGEQTTAGGAYSHSEGNRSAASGTTSHAEGNYTTASGNYSHAEGNYSVASGLSSHAEGGSRASGSFSHAEGYYTLASGNESHSEGYATTASGKYSHAEGYYTYTNDSVEGCHVMGRYNTVGTGSPNLFIIGYGSLSARRNVLSVDTGGNLKAFGYISQESVADYAEYFEWKDGNIDFEDRVGYFVTFDDNVTDKIRIANNNDEYILGIVSGAPAVLANGDCDSWNGMVLRDEFNRVIYERAPMIDEESREEVLDDNGNILYYGTRPKINPDYNPDEPYVSRADRPEWSPIGMLGVLSVRQDGTCIAGKYCTVNDNGIATICDDNSKNNKYRVTKILNEEVVKVVFTIH